MLFGGRSVRIGKDFAKDQHIFQCPVGLQAYAFGVDAAVQAAVVGVGAHCFDRNTDDSVLFKIGIITRVNEQGLGRFAVAVCNVNIVPADTTFSGDAVD